MRSIVAPSLCFLAVAVVPRTALAVKSGELYTSASHAFGRFEASIKFASGDGVVGAFFLWKDGSEVEGTFWNELDFEKIGADCQLASNAYYGNPATVHSQKHTPSMLLCGSYHTYAFEWTPDYIAWFVDGMQIRRDTGATATAYAQNAAAGMQLRFNIWPGDASFGGNFNPSILPVYQEIDWVQYSSYANGTFTVAWRDDFNSASLDPRWLLGTWDSPKGLSQHDVLNVGVVNGHAIIALTSDEGVGEGVPRPPQGGAGGMGGAAGTAGAGGSVSGGAGGVNTGGSSGAVSGGASGEVSGGTGAGGAGGAGATGGSVSGGASGTAAGGTLSSGGSAVGGAGASPASGAPGSGGQGGSVPGVSGNPSSGGPSPRGAPRSDGGGCTTSPHRPYGSGGLFVLTLAALGAFFTRRTRRPRVGG